MSGMPPACMQTCSSSRNPGCFGSHQPGAWLRLPLQSPSTTADLLACTTAITLEWCSQCPSTFHFYPLARLLISTPNNCRCALEGGAIMPFYRSSVQPQTVAARGCSSTCFLTTLPPQQVLRKFFGGDTYKGPCCLMVPEGKGFLEP